MGCTCCKPKKEPEVIEKPLIWVIGAYKVGKSKLTTALGKKYKYSVLDVEYLIDREARDERTTEAIMIKDLRINHQYIPAIIEESLLGREMTWEWPQCNGFLLDGYMPPFVSRYNLELKTGKVHQIIWIQEEDDDIKKRITVYLENKDPTKTKAQRSKEVKNFCTNFRNFRIEILSQFPGRVVTISGKLTTSEIFKEACRLVESLLPSITLPVSVVTIPDPYVSDGRVPLRTQSSLTLAPDLVISCPEENPAITLLQDPVSSLALPHEDL